MGFLRGLGFLLLVVGLTAFGFEAFHRPPLRCYVPNLVEGQDAPRAYCERGLERARSIEHSLAAERKQLVQQISRMEEAFAERMMDMTSDSRVRREDTYYDEPQALTDKRFELSVVEAEYNQVRWAVRVLSFPLVEVLLGVAGVGALLVGLSFLNVGGARAPRPFRRLLDIYDEEKYVNPTKAEAMLTSMLPTPDAAALDLWTIRPKECGYCGHKLPLKPPGEIVHVHLYKEAPMDVSAQKKIPLGDGYRSVAPDYVECPDCGHRNKFGGGV